MRQWDVKKFLCYFLYFQAAFSKLIDSASSATSTEITFSELPYCPSSDPYAVFSKQNNKRNYYKDFCPANFAIPDRSWLIGDKAWLDWSSITIRSQYWAEIEGNFSLKVKFISHYYNDSGQFKIDFHPLQVLNPQTLRLLRREIRSNMPKPQIKVVIKDRVPIGLKEFLIFYYAGFTLLFAVVTKVIPLVDLLELNLFHRNHRRNIERGAGRYEEKVEVPEAKLEELDLNAELENRGIDPLKDAVLKDLVCPITHMLPNVAFCVNKSFSKIYEKQAIFRWIEQAGRTLETGEPCTTEDIIPAMILDDGHLEPAKSFITKRVNELIHEHDNQEKLKI